MKRNRIFIMTALVLVSVFVLASCVQGATDINETAKPTEEMATQEPTEKPMEDESMEEKPEATSEDMKEDKGEEMVDTSLTFTGDAYNFDLVDTAGKSYKLSDLQGKKVYVKFWASWCSICLAGLSEVDELHAEYADNDDVVILTLVSPEASGELTADKFKIWFRTEGYKFKVLLDQDGPVQREFGIRGFPTSVFIDTMGNVHDIKVGHVDNSTINSVLSEMS